MSTAEELTEKIIAKGNEIRELKAAKPATLKDDLVPLIASLNELKVEYKEITGDEYGGSSQPQEPKKKKEVPDVQVEREGPSKAELNKMKRKAAKEEHKKAEASTNPQPESAGEGALKVAQEGEEAMAHLYGDSPLVCSDGMTDRVFRQISNLTPAHAGTSCWFRARVSNSRAVSKGCFLVLRQNISTIQAIAWQSTSVPKALVKYASSISLESVVDVLATITVPETPVLSTTMKTLELHIIEIHVVSRAQSLPFIVEDAGRGDAEAAATGLPTVSQETSLNYRWIDMRTPANQAIFRIQSGVCQLFREFFLANKFVEIHTPKLIGGASEGGANVFKLSYFDSPACLAQSPQLYKQMAAACGGFERVFEIGPVFRAENSNTHRHLCEFTGLDFEMAIYEHYYEALEMMGNMFVFMFDGIADRFAHELVLISQQYPFEPISYPRTSLRLTFQEGIALLNEAGIPASYDDDLSTPHEKELGRIVKEKYGADFFMMDKYPLSVRPFYTMPDPCDPKLSNSYDLFIRGEEIVSGAQRVHDVDLLLERAKAWKVPIDSIQSYVDAFKHGVLPHAGGGVGLERVVMLYLGLKNIRKTSLFPRDPSRLTP